MIRHEVVDRLGRHVLVTVAALSAVACAGGGGGSGSAPAPTATIASSPPPPAAPPPPPPPPPGPSAASAEFTKNYALGAIHADAAFAAGASGAGITVAVIDTGVDGSSSELQGRVSPQSIDANATRATPVGADPHATWVAGVLASNFNGFGTVGVAYNSTVLSVRADTGGTCGGDACLSSTLAASGIDYAIGHGAKVVNLSFGSVDGTPLGPTFEAALQRGVNAGLVFTISAGNESAANPDWPGMYAVDPRYAGSIIVAGATTRSGTLASYSNQAGSAQAAYMTAPGSNIITACDTTGCEVVSGTSFSAPEIAGALALLLQAFPNMSGKQAIALLLQTADAEGAASIYGVGGLDLSRAFQPVGTLSVAQVSGSAVGLSMTPGAFVSSAMGDAIVRSQSLITVGRDRYDRLFRVNLAQGFRPAGASILAADPAVQVQSSDISLPSFAQGLMRVTASLETGRLDPADHFHWMLASDPGGELMVSYERAGFSASVWKGGAGSVPFGAPIADAFVSTAQVDHAVQTAFAASGWRLLAEAGGGRRLSPDRMRLEAGASYSRAAVERALGPIRLTFGGGALVEPQGPLGSYLPQRSGFGLPSKTGFVASSLRWSLAPGVDFNGEASAGRTQLDGAFLQTAGPALSSAWRMSLDANCRVLGLMCTDAHLSLSQPLRIERGDFTAVLADAPQNPDDPLTFSTRRFSAAPSGREVDLRLQADRDLGRFGVVSLEGVAARQPANIAAAPAAFGLLAGWKLGF